MPKPSTLADGPVPASQFLDRAADAPLPACVVLAGAEGWFRRMATERVLAAVFPGGDPGGGVLRLDARDTTQREQAFGAAEELRAAGLFGAGRVVIVESPEALGQAGAALDDPDADGDADEAAVPAPAAPGAPAPQKRVKSPLLALAEPALEAAIAGSVLVLSTVRPVKGQGAVPLATLTKKGALVVDCRPLYDAPGPWERGAAAHDHELARHLVRRAKAGHGKRLALPEAHALTRRIGSDLGDLEQALETLALYAGARASLSAADVDACFAGEREDPVWGLVDAVLDGRPAEALARLEAAFSEGLTDARGGAPISRPEALFPLVSGALFSAWRRVLGGAEALARGEPDAEVARAAGLPAFKAEAHLRRCRRDARAWARLGQAFLAAEEGLKQGLVPPEVALTRLVAELAQPADVRVQHA